VHVNDEPLGGPGVLAGQHTDQLLAELGYPPDEIVRLRAASLVASEPS
jgi:crotonobetainyl-CoA:carnitine CoA-transferase CaiB-like acyl-CoA transferase